MTKPVVLYDHDKSYQWTIQHGKRATVSVLNHDLITTGQVIRLGSNGEFETHETIYKANNPIQDN